MNLASNKSLNISDLFYVIKFQNCQHAHYTIATIYSQLKHFKQRTDTNLI